MLLYNREIIIVTYEEFINNYRFKEKTIENKAKKGEIPGMQYVSGEYIIEDGTRYPYNIGRNKLKSLSDKVYVFLKATHMFMYIDHTMLKMTSGEFNNMISELLSAGLICRNGIANTHGANGYSCTIICDEFILEKKYRAIKLMVNILANALGTIEGAFVSQLNQ